jgi:hypothetical protein
LKTLWQPNFRKRVIFWVRNLDAAMPSTAIRYFRYDPAQRELDVTFVTRRHYIYEGVPPEVFDAFKAKGTFFNREIRDRYGFREITREKAGPAADLFRR